MCGAWQSSRVVAFPTMSAGQGNLRERGDSGSTFVRLRERVTGYICAVVLFELVHRKMCEVMTQNRQ